MLGALTSLTGGGGLSASSSATATGGETSASLNNSFQNNSPFQVGGSGRQSQTADQGGNGAAKDNTVLYVALGIAGLAVFALILKK
jgi:hypothetical protein